MKHSAFPFLFLSFFLLFSCQSEESALQPVTDVRELSFRVVNYVQYGFEDITRAQSVTKLAHLSCAVFDAETDTLVFPVEVQDRDCEGYGTFKLSLPYGNYRLLFLGYDGNKALELTSSHAVSFADNYVPHTFIYCMPFQVGAETKPVSDVVLQRAVSAFRLSLLDAIPEQVQTICMKSDIGGVVLDATTGFSVGSPGRTAAIDIPSDRHGIQGLSLTYYLYMPSTEATAELVVSALDAQQNVVRSRTFGKVPMAVNRLTVYEGEFFSEDLFDATSSLTVDYDWNDTLTVRF